MFDDCVIIMNMCVIFYGCVFLRYHQIVVNVSAFVSHDTVRVCLFIAVQKRSAHASLPFLPYPLRYRLAVRRDVYGDVEVTPFMYSYYWAWLVIDVCIQVRGVVIKPLVLQFVLLDAHFFVTRTFECSPQLLGVNSLYI